MILEEPAGLDAERRGVEVADLGAAVTMPAMRSTIEAIRAAGKRDPVKVIVGGAPVTQQYTDEIGAEGYSHNAMTAVGLARTLTAMGHGIT